MEALTRLLSELVEIPSPNPPGDCRAIAAFIVNTPVLLEKIAIPLSSNFLIYLLAFMGLGFLTRRMLEGHSG